MYYSCVKNWRDGLPCHTLCLIFTNRLKVEVGNGPSFRCFRPYHCFNLLTHRSLPLCLYPAFDPMLSLLLMAGYRPVSIFNFHPPAGNILSIKPTLMIATMIVGSICNGALILLHNTISSPILSIIAAIKEEVRIWCNIIEFKFRLWTFKLSDIYIKSLRLMKKWAWKNGSLANIEPK